MGNAKTKKQRRLNSGASADTMQKDSGPRYRVIGAGEYPHRQVYGGNGVSKAEAERLAEGLVHDAYIEEVPERP